MLKFFPALSPASNLAAQTIHSLTFGAISPKTALLVLSIWESLNWPWFDRWSLSASDTPTPVGSNIGDNHALVPVPRLSVFQNSVCSDIGRSVHHQEHRLDKRRPGDWRDSSWRSNDLHANRAQSGRKCGLTPRWSGRRHGAISSSEWLSGAAQLAAVSQPFAISACRATMVSRIRLAGLSCGHPGHY